jgi:hypothetical protein
MISQTRQESHFRQKKYDAVYHGQNFLQYVPCLRMCGGYYAGLIVALRSGTWVAYG